VGPAFEVGLPLGLGVEVDALYRRDGYSSASGNFAGSVFNRERVNSWEFPILLSYQLRVPVVKPFAEVGFAPRVGSGTLDGSLSISIPTQSYQQTHTSAAWQTSQGLVVGGGVRLALGHLQLSPEVRYTHWNNAAFSGNYPDGPSYQSTQNQVDVLLGIGWKTR
jgi:opacity protein-like surface antigen